VSRRPLTPGAKAARVTLTAPAAAIEEAEHAAREAGFKSLSAWTRLLWRHGLPELAPSIDDLIAMEQER
jgi:hypothetical protein